MSKEVPVEPTIPNWTFFSTHRVVIDLFKHTPKNETEFYNVVLTMLLDDGTDDQRGISIITDLNMENIEEVLHMTMDSVLILFDNVSANVDIYDAESGDVIDSFDMNELAAHDMEVETAKDNRVLH